MSSRVLLIAPSTPGRYLVHVRDIDYLRILRLSHKFLLLVFHVYYCMSLTVLQNSVISSSTNCSDLGKPAMPSGQSFPNTKTSRTYSTFHVAPRMYHRHGLLQKACCTRSNRQGSHVGGMTFSCPWGIDEIKPGTRRTSAAYLHHVSLSSYSRFLYLIFSSDCHMKRCLHEHAIRDMIAPGAVVIK